MKQLVKRISAINYHKHKSCVRFDQKWTAFVKHQTCIERSITNNWRVFEFDLFVVINNVNQWVLTDQSLFVNLIAQEINQLFQNKQTESGLL